MTSPTVSVIVPTWNRHERHAALYETFASQTLAQSGDADMHVLDDSPTASPFFTQLRDTRVHYKHTTQRMSIGAKRNALIEGSIGEVVSQFEDDDAYCINYTERKLARLRSTGADLVKLAIWNAICERDGSVWQWDTRTIGPEHWAVTGNAPPEKVSTDDMGEPSPELLDSQLWGYGFSYTFRRSAWVKSPFPDISLGEDYTFVRGLREKGCKLALIDDMASSVLHSVHTLSTSTVFPQRRLRSATLGAMPPTPMPAGDLHARPNVTYTIVALLKSSHELRDITGKAQSWGLSVLSVQDNVAAPAGEKAAPSGYRYLTAEFTVDRAKKILAKVPWPLSHLDKTRIVRAWSDQPQVNTQLAPSAGVAGFIGTMGNSSCMTCANFAWHGAMGGAVRGHHPSCPELSRGLRTQVYRPQINVQLTPV